MLELLLATALTMSSAPDPADSYLYRTLLLRAAPGSLLEVIDRYRERMPVFDAAGAARPFIMRHSQGDQWDLMLLFPIESFGAYYTPERIAQREAAGRDAGATDEEFERALGEHIAWREETFVAGPLLHVVKAAFADNSYYHIEMFIAVAGKRAELLKQRQMENAYLEGIDRPQNLIFTRVAGGAWDLYTVGFYQDIKHYAASADIPDELQELAAKKAGFEGADRIGTYLRTLMQSHHDTLARAVR